MPAKVIANSPASALMHSISFSSSNKLDWSRTTPNETLANLCEPVAPFQATKAKKKVHFSQQTTLYFLATRPPSNITRPLSALTIAPLNCNDHVNNGYWLSDIEGMRNNPFCKLDYLREKVFSKRPQSSDFLFPLESDCTPSPDHVLEGEVAVFNIDYTKEIRVHFSFDETWQSKGVVRAEYSSSIATLRIDKFKFSLPVPENNETESTIQLVVEYRVAGTVYWDSFDGSNYRFALQRTSTDCFEEEPIHDIQFTEHDALWPAEAQTQSMPIPIRPRNVIYHRDEFGSSQQSIQRAFNFSAPLTSIRPKLSPAVSRIPSASWSQYSAHPDPRFYLSTQVY